MFSSSSLWQKSMVALFASNCSRATFIFSCRCSSSSEKLAGPPLEEAWGHATKGMLATCSVFGRVSWSSWGVMWAKLRVPAGMAICRDVCVRVANKDRSDRVCPLWPEWIFQFFGCWQSLPSCRWWPSPWCAAPGDRGWGDRGSLLQSLHGAHELQVDCCSDVTWGISSVGQRGGRTIVEVRVWMAVVMLSDCMLPWSTSISCGLWVGLLGLVASKRESSLEDELQGLHLTIQAFQAHHQALVL